MFILYRINISITYEMEKLYGEIPTFRLIYLKHLFLIALVIIADGAYTARKSGIIIIIKLVTRGRHQELEKLKENATLTLDLMWHCTIRWKVTKDFEPLCSSSRVCNFYLNDEFRQLSQESSLILRIPSDCNLIMALWYCWYPYTSFSYQSILIVIDTFLAVPILYKEKGKGKNLNCYHI